MTGHSTILRTLGAIALAAACLSLRPANAEPKPSVFDLDDFERPLRVVQPASADPSTRFLWNLYTAGGSRGRTDVTSEMAERGGHSLHSRYDGGPNWQFQFYPTTTTSVHFAREFVSNPSAWVLNRVNRLRFWIKVPQGLAPAPGGDANFQFGTYIRCSRCGRYEEGGGHFYHHYNLAASSEWQQIIVDTHPNHARSADSNAEEGDQVHPTKEAGFTYFDLLTRFYFDFPYATGPGFPVPADFYIDNVQFYEDPRPENVEQVYSLDAVYEPRTNTVSVGWRHSKNEGTIRHEVRYAFSDIYALGWGNAQPAPGGIVAPLGAGGYNGMEWSTRELNLSGRAALFVAIKPQNSARFRQIEIPIARSTS